MSPLISMAAPRIGIALSGGTLKATAHFGALVALEELNIRPDVVAGTSAGAFVGTLFAHGYNTAQFQQLIKSFPGKSLLDYGFPISYSIAAIIKNSVTGEKENYVTPKGLLRGEKLASYFNEALKDRKPLLPYYILTTDLVSGNSVVFSNHSEAIDRGIAHPIENLSQTILGSCAIPGVFSPVRIKNWLLVDGAFRHYVPVQVLRRIGCQKVIAINLYRLKREWRPHTVLDVLARSFDILLQETVDDDIQGVETFVLTPDVSDVHSLSLNKLDECWKLGYNTVKKNESALMDFLSSNSTANDSDKTIRVSKTSTVTSKPSAPVVYFHAKP